MASGVPAKVVKAIAAVSGPMGGVHLIGIRKAWGSLQRTDAPRMFAGHGHHNAPP